MRMRERVCVVNVLTSCRINSHSVNTTAIPTLHTHAHWHHTTHLVHADQPRELVYIRYAIAILPVPWLRSQILYIYVSGHAHKATS